MFKADRSELSTETQLWRGALTPSLLVTVICIFAAALLRHHSGALGALLASITVLIFFSVHLAINQISKNLDPMATMALAMFSYFAKVFLMGAFLIIVTKTSSPSSVDRPSFAVTALAITAAWLSGEIRAFMKLRLVLPLPTRSSTSDSQFQEGGEGNG